MPTDPQPSSGTESDARRLADAEIDFEKGVTELCQDTFNSANPPGVKFIHGPEPCDSCAVLASALRRVAEATRKKTAERCAGMLEEQATHYPEKIFREPPPGEHGKTVDGCSARALRTALPEIAKAIREEMGKATGVESPR